MSPTRNAATRKFAATVSIIRALVNFAKRHVATIANNWNAKRAKNKTNSLKYAQSAVMIALIAIETFVRNTLSARLCKWLRVKPATSTPVWTKRIQKSLTTMYSVVSSALLKKRKKQESARDFLRKFN